MLKYLMAAAFAIVTIAGEARAAELTGYCTGVIDGGTLSVLSGSAQHTVKLAYIDPPLPDQKFGPEAKNFVEELALRQNLKLKIIAPGQKYITAEVYSPKKQDCINRLLVRQGLAWTAQGDTPYGLALSYAKKKSLGIWSVPGLQSPAELRAAQELEPEKEEPPVRRGHFQGVVPSSPYPPAAAQSSGDAAPVEQQLPYREIETRPGYRAEDILAAEQRQWEQDQARKRQECLDGFSSAHSGSGEYSLQQRQMDYNEWAIRCGAEPPYPYPGGHYDRGPDHRYINKDPYHLADPYPRPNPHPRPEPRPSPAPLPSPKPDLHPKPEPRTTTTSVLIFKPRR